MSDASKLDKALQGEGKLAEAVERFLQSSYGTCADIRYERARYSAALAKFADAFPDAKGVSIARAPGRVNLIGEHTDYNGLPALPMAIERDIVIVFAKRSDRRVNLINTSYCYPPRSFEITKRIKPYGPGNWGNYAKAAIQAIQEVSPRPLRGVDACISGDIPFGAGLSSSSAMVVAVSTAILAANELVIDRQSLAEVLARGERYVGTEGGGMDQAVSLVAEAGHALRVGFFPFDTTLVRIPNDCTFVVADSLVPAEKSGSARNEYNQRVIECRLGVAMLGRVKAEELGFKRELTMLGGLKRLSQKRMFDAIDQLPDEAMSLREIAKFAGFTTSKLKESALRLGNGELFHEPRGGFKVKQRVRHVLTEGKRVEQAVKSLENEDAERFGRLMNESHKSCAKDYEISTPELDALVSICHDSGALGASLTGAGFGGCVVALIEDKNTSGFVSSLIEHYYNGYLVKERKSAEISFVSLEDAVFPCKPCGGATVL